MNTMLAKIMKTFKMITVTMLTIAICGCSATSTNTTTRRINHHKTDTLTSSTTSSSTSSASDDKDTVDNSTESNDDLWAKSPRFVDERNAYEWYIDNHSLLTEEQESLLANEKDIPTSDDADWQVYPAIIGGEECILSKEEEYVSFHYMTRMNRYHIHCGSNAENATEIFFSDEHSVFYDSKSSKLRCYREGGMYWETEVGSDFAFCGISDELGFVFHNTKTQTVKIIENFLYEVRKDELQNVAVVLETNYFAGSTCRVPLVMMNDGSVMIYFGDHYTGPLQRLYEGDKVDLDQPEKDFGDHVLRKPRFDMGAVPWAGDTGL